MTLRRHLGVPATLGLLAGSLVLAACSSATSSNSAALVASSNANRPAAKAVLAPYTGHPSKFPVTQPLTRRPIGKTFAYLQCSTPICGLFAQLFPPAAKALGVKLRIVKAGPSAQALQAAMNTIISEKPAAVLLPAIEPDVVSAQLAQLHKMGIPVAASGIMNGKKFGIGAPLFDTSSAELAGRILAAWVIKDKATKANVAFYLTPELSFGAYLAKGFATELHSLCASCAMRTVIVPVATIGTTAPSLVVSDLQAHPASNVAVFSTEEAATGLPAALKIAGINIVTTGFGPNPVNLADVKSGGLTSGLAIDFPVIAWTAVDAAARMVTGQALATGEQAGLPDMQMLEQRDITFNPMLGYTGYPDFAQLFAKLWKA